MMAPGRPAGVEAAPAVALTDASTYVLNPRLVRCVLNKQVIIVGARLNRNDACIGIAGGEVKGAEAYVRAAVHDEVHRLAGQVLLVYLISALSKHLVEDGQVASARPEDHWPSEACGQHYAVNSGPRTNPVADVVI